MRFSGGWRELAAASVAAIVVTAALTYPLSFNLGTVGRTDSRDGMFSVWNVAWVARTLAVDPLHVFDANIFYPHRGTLAYSEANLGAGTLALPAYWVTRNPHFAHNSAVMLALILCALGTYYLARYLIADRRAAAVSAICFAFTPHVFGHTPHVQLMMTLGLPYSMLAFHRMADRPSLARACALGAAMAATTVFCAYYGVFVLLMVGFAIVAIAAIRWAWRNAQYWIAVATAAAVAIVLILPLFEPYFTLQGKGFSRPLSEAEVYSADWRTYLTSSARAHVWIWQLVGKGKEVAFPGFVAAAFGIIGVAIGWRAGGRSREIVVLYGTLGILAFWASFGPTAKLYTAMYHTVPAVALMRAPARFALVVAFALSILTGLAVQALLARVPKRATAIGVVIAIAAAAELMEVLRFRQVPVVSPTYHMLATLPPAPLIEMPFWSRNVDFNRHADYMLSSTAHWMPMINGYSDYIPPDVRDHAPVLAAFPTREAFKILEPAGVRYAIFHRRWYNRSNWNDVTARLQEYAPYFRPVHVDAAGSDDEIRLYEIVGYPK